MRVGLFDTIGGHGLSRKRAVASLYIPVRRNTIRRGGVDDVSPAELTFRRPVMKAPGVLQHEHPPSGKIVPAGNVTRIRQNQTRQPMAE